MCCVISCLLKFILGIVASALMIIGIILTVVGGFLLWGFDTLIKMIIPITDQLQSLLKNVGVQADVKNIMNLIKGLATPIGAVAFAIGLVFLIIAVLIYISICCCPSKALFIVLAIILSAIAIALIVILAYYGSNPKEKILQPLPGYIQQNIINKYVGFESTNAESIIVNIVHITNKCCGIYNYSDFDNSKTFQRTGSLNGGKYTFSGILFPISCCDYNKDFIIASTSLDDCTKKYISNTKNIGCFTTLMPQLELFIKSLLISIGVVIAVLVATVFVIICLICCMEKLK